MWDQYIAEAMSAEGGGTEKRTLLAMTDEERARAQEKASHTRKVKSAILAKLADGDIDLKDLLNGSFEGDEDTKNTAKTIKLADIVRVLRRTTRVKASGFLTELGISATRRVRGASKKQVVSLLSFLGHPSASDAVDSGNGAGDGGAGDGGSAE